MAKDSGVRSGGRWQMPAGEKVQGCREDSLVSPDKSGFDGGNSDPSCFIHFLRNAGEIPEMTYFSSFRVSLGDAVSPEGRKPRSDDTVFVAISGMVDKT